MLIFAVFSATLRTFRDTLRGVGAMHPELKQILANGPVVTDGAWGTQLQQRGLETGKHPDLWNLTHQDQVREVAQAYVDAGSRIILTNTFGCNRFVLGRFEMQDKVGELNRLGVNLSQDAAKGDAKVFASMGPSGIMLLAGNVTENELYEAFHEQASAFLEADADGIVIETMSDPAEAVIAVKAAKTTGLPIVVTMVFDSGKDKDRTMMGTTPEQAVEQLSAAGADAVGSNCGQGIDGFLSICKRMKVATDLPIWIKANAGLPEIVDGQTIYRQTPEAFAEKALEIVGAGASFIGGCCGTSPEYIRALAEKLKKN